MLKGSGDILSTWNRVLKVLSMVFFWTVIQQLLLGDALHEDSFCKRERGLAVVPDEGNEYLHIT